MKDSFAENYWDSIKGHESSQENLCEFEEKTKIAPVSSHDHHHPWTLKIEHCKNRK